MNFKGLSDWEKIRSLFYLNSSIITKFFLCISLFVVFGVKMFNIRIPYYLFDDSTIEPFNEICLNLSYSYIAGYLIYVFTVKLPDYSDKLQYKGYIGQIIRKYRDRQIKLFLLLSTDKTYFDSYIKDKEELNKAHMKYEEKGGIYKSSEDLKIIKDMDNTVSDFFNEISIYERFMDKDSENIIHSIRNEKKLLKELSDQLNGDKKNVLEENSKELESFMNLFFDLAKLSGNEMSAN